MNNFMMVTNASTHQLYDALLGIAGRRGGADHDQRDRGAVSLEQVLWFAAAGVAVAVIAGILFQRITDEASNTNIDNAPTPINPNP